METIKVALVRCISQDSYDSYSGYKLIAASITDWQEISRDDYQLLCRCCPTGYVVVVKPTEDEQKELILKSVADGIRAAKKHQAEEKARQEERDRKKALRLEKQLLKDKKAKLELFNKLKEELGEQAS